MVEVDWALCYKGQVELSALIHEVEPDSPGV